ncbi:MAG: hypothetical protein Q4D62_02000 [Planctomycetia bacterium]|nr:hypothetical protein [Planctomycetia bacterium]
MRNWGMILGMICLLGVGCGSPKLPVVTWEGEVTLSGKPIPAGAIAEISVYTASGEGISQGTRGEIVNGHYLLEDVPVGDVRVSFNIVERIPSKNPQDVGRGITICQSLLSEDFQPLEEKAIKSEKGKNFDLSTEKKKFSQSQKVKKNRVKSRKNTLTYAKR